MNVRQEPIPAAYRVFFRHIGLDPDVTRTPIEAAVLERMLEGGFLSEGLLADILTIGLIDTAVPVWALDADTVNGPLGIRVSRSEERLGRGHEGPSLGAGRLVVADADSPLAILFGQLAPGHEPSSQTRRLCPIRRAGRRRARAARRRDAVGVPLGVERCRALTERRGSDGGIWRRRRPTALGAKSLYRDAPAS